MPQRYFYIDEGKQQCLTASWKYNWKNFKLRLQDQEIASFTMKDELAEGQDYVMPDGRLLSVRLNCAVQPELVLMLNGAPVPGSDTDPRLQVKNNFLLALFLGILNMAGGVAAVLLQSETLLDFGFGYETTIMGVAYLFLSWGIKRLSLFAVYAMILLVALDIILIFTFAAVEGGTGSSLTSGLLLKLFFIYSFVKGMKAMKQLKAKDTVATAA